MKKIATLIALALASSTCVRAATYYVSTSGNDGNNGTSLGTPWRTINKAAQTMVAGDIAYIRGGTYRESVFPARDGTSASARITYSAYNSEQVIISGADIFTGWAASGNAWRIPWTLSLPTYSSELVFRREMVIVDGVVMRAVGSRAEVVPGTFFVEGTDTAPTAIYLRLPGDAAPTGHTIECVVRHPVFDAGSHGWLRVAGLTFRHAANRAQWAMCTFGMHDSIIESNLFEWSNGLGIAQSGRNNTYLYCTSRDNAQMGWGGYGTNNLIENCKSFRNNWKGFDPGWEAGGTKFVFTTNTTIRKFESGFNEGPGIWLDIENYGNTIEQCWVYSNKLAGIMIEYKSDNNVIRNNVAHGTRFFAYAAAGILTQAAKNNTYVHNTCIANEGPGIYIRGDGRWQNGGNKVFNNLLMRNASSPLYVGGSVGGDMEIEHGNGANIGNQLNGNIYFHPNSTANSKTFFWSADYFLSDDINGWRARTGGDGNSIIADPLVQNWQSATGWHLTASSPARGLGVTPPVPVTVDFDGNPRPGSGADAGADQFTTGNNPPTVSITSPANGGTFTAPANITINANASDSDGTVSKVDFYQGTSLLGTDTSSPYSFAWNNVAAGSYALKAVATDNAGAATTSSVVNVTVNPPGSGGTGLKGDYYDNSDFTVFKLTRTDATVNFNWGTGSPDPSVGVDTFSVRWTGKVQPQFSQTYTFYTVTDDGVRLWVNNQLLIDKWIVQAPTEWSGQIALTANQQYDIKMEYYENGGGAEAHLSWSSPSVPKAVIPQGQLFPAGANLPPTVSITSPASGAIFTAPANITINANASDSDGTVSKVDFYQGTTLLGTDTTSPYSFAWNNVAAGSYALKAVATDNLNATATSAVVNVTVNAAGQTPYGGTAWAIPGQIQAENYDVGGEGIAYHDNDTANQGGQYRTDGVDIKTTADAGGGYTVGWLNANEWLEYTVNVAAAGNYTIQARVGTISAGRTFRVEFNGVDKTGWISVPVFGAYDTYGTVSVPNVSLSAGQQVMRMLMGPQDFMDFNWINIVAAANTPPTVSITSPANGATFTAPANITINANASDSDGTVSKVDFYQGTTLLGTDTTSPYSFAWNNVAVGSYALKAVATDNTGAATTSSVVNVTVNSALITPVYQVNAGGSAVSPFVSDAYFANGTPFSTANVITTNGVVAPAPMAVYQSYRYVWGSNNVFSYTFTNLVANTQHKVRLHFADFYNSAANQRKFHVDINGTRVLTNFDIIATAGGANRATIQEFTPNSDGTGRITLVFTATSLDSACVNAIEVFR